MTVRFYILPIERNLTQLARGPKYFAWRLDPDPPGLPDAWRMLDYGLIDMALVCADVSDASHLVLSEANDVLSIPVDLDATLTAGAVSVADGWCEDHGIPAHWISIDLTYRQVLRCLSGMFLYIQRVTAILGAPITMTGGMLNKQVRNVSVTVRNAMSQAADEFGYNYSGVTGTTTIRQMLKSMADAWGNQSVYFGNLGTL